ncbi:MAG TPA: DNA translocase FtsK 4TM domain-containing protein [Desulfomonilia bacterium]
MPRKEKKDINIKKIASLAMLALAILMLLSLVSYSGTDPGFTHAADTSNIHNLTGLVGAYIADGLLLIFGLGAFLIPLMLAEYAWLTFRDIKIGIIKGISSVVLFFVIISLIGVFFGDAGVWGGSVKAGGVIGLVVGKGLSAYLKTWGSLVVLLTMFFAALVIGYDLKNAWGAIKSLVMLDKPAITRPEKRIREDEPQEHAEPEKIKDKKQEKKKKEPQISRLDTEKTKLNEKFEQAKLSFEGEYELPPRSLLREVQNTGKEMTAKELNANAELITAKLRSLNIEGEILQIRPGPLITMYEFTPAPGIKINRIVSLADDLSMALKASPVRVVAPIPGKNAVGIEVPNKNRRTVFLKTIIASSAFINASSPLTVGLGTDIEGAPVVIDLAKMPHLLIAGATGTGKSVGLNTMILSLLYRCYPDELKFIMIDPKRIELSHYEGIPHLLHPVVTDSREALPILKWLISEMEMRYQLFKETTVKSLDTYNKKIRSQNRNAETTLAIRHEDGAPPGILPRLVLVVDEMADLTMSNRETQEFIIRLAQMARAAGIHLIMATQRPSVDVVTGLIKANFPSRISFRVSQGVDSRTILDSNGAEQLLGNGDMLFLSPGHQGLMRIHGAYVTEEEVDSVVNFIREQKGPDYISDIEEHIQAQVRDEDDGGDENGSIDEVYDEALEFVTQKGSASISLVQRRFRIGYNRAARIIEQMEREGVVGPSDAAGKPRKVLVKPYGKEMDE